MISTREALAKAWDDASPTYQERQQIPTHTVRYGPYGPTEDDIALLGEVAGIRVLDLGCGGGQSCIALARQGARVTGLDFSLRQIEFARQLAVKEGVMVTFVQGEMRDLSIFSKNTFDLVLALYAFPYVADLSGCLAECQRVLRPGGRLVFSLDHPFADCFWDQTSAEYVFYPARSYFDPQPLDWHFSGDHGPQMRTYRYPIGKWAEMLRAAGLPLQQLVEQPAPQDLADAPWATDFDREIGGLIPYTLICQAEKAL